MTQMVLRLQLSLPMEGAAMLERPMLPFDGDESSRMPTLPEEDGAEIATVIHRMLLTGGGMVGAILALALAWAILG
jgi:hypothetical protein